MIELWSDREIAKMELEGFHYADLWYNDGKLTVENTLLAHGSEWFGAMVLPIAAIAYGNLAKRPDRKPFDDFFYKIYLRLIISERQAGRLKSP